MTILQPILHPEQFEAIGLSTPAGVLLFGPPGEHLAVCSVRLPRLSLLCGNTRRLTISNVGY